LFHHQPEAQHLKSSAIHKLGRPITPCTGRWRDERSAKRYTHTAAHEEWDRVDFLPSIGKSVETTVKKAKAQ
jgi:hypothetical protein